ncbi:MAG TPA: glycoside hydrolase family 25 protein [Chitinophagaceae bacterium]|nr:glycoside hydrolase family 25 protein [Chitinophagaceae bacterium]
MPTRRQKKLIAKIAFFTFLATALAIGVSLLYKSLSRRRASFVRYPEFGISMPESYSIHGIDVSKYQHSIAWEEVKAMKVKNIQLGFAFMKATEGIANDDPKFKRNWKKSKDAGVCRGAYHFFIGSKDGKMQAEHFIDRVELEPGDLPPVLDVEQLNSTPVSQLKREAKEWLEIVEAHYGVKPIIYTNVDFYNRYLGEDFDEYPLWVAHYYQPVQPRIRRGWVLWQHSDRGRVNGIVSPVDFNVFNGDSAEFRELLIR